MACTERKSFGKAQTSFIMAIDKRESENHVKLACNSLYRHPGNSLSTHYRHESMSISILLCSISQKRFASPFLSSCIILDQGAQPLSEYSTLLYSISGFPREKSNAFSSLPNKVEYQHFEKNSKTISIECSNLIQSVSRRCGYFFT